MINKLNLYGKVEENVNLVKYNTYRVNSMVKYLVEPNDLNSLTELIRYLNEMKVKYFIIGNGSNIILQDCFYDGVFIKLTKLNALEINGNLVYVEAGVMLPYLASETIKSNLKGLEFIAGIPGTVGGSVYNNAGAYNSEFFDFITDVIVLDSNFKLKTIPKDQISYGYRSTAFKTAKDSIIIGCHLKLDYGNALDSQALVEDRKRRRINSQPLDKPSAGSVFRNPENNFAGKLIEDCNLKGYKIGSAKISEKHANFIVTDFNANGEDIIKLIDFVRQKVLETYSINMVSEQEIVKWK